MSSDTADIFNFAGGAVNDFFGAKGANASASSFGDAATIADQNAAITQESTAVQDLQEQRQIFQTLGKQQAQVGGAGFAESGTALDLLRDSATQGALVRALTAEQGAITENSFEEQAGMFRGMEEASKSSAKGQQLGGALNILGAGASLAGSDAGSSLISGIGSVFSGAADFFGSSGAADLLDVAFV